MSEKPPLVRPYYESKSDLQNEAHIKELLERIWDLSLYKLPPKYGADFIAYMNGSEYCLIEVKTRSHKKNDYPTFFISLHKIVTTIPYCTYFDIPLLVVVSWTDVTGYVVIEQPLDQYDVKMQNINFRNDPMDIEPCVHIDINDFTIIESKKK